MSRPKTSSLLPLDYEIICTRDPRLASAGEGAVRIARFSVMTELSEAQMEALSRFVAQLYRCASGAEAETALVITTVPTFTPAAWLAAARRNAVSQTEARSPI
jgi:hypothetical protein